MFLPRSTLLPLTAIASCAMLAGACTPLDEPAAPIAGSPVATSSPVATPAGPQPTSPSPSSSKTTAKPTSTPRSSATTPLSPSSTPTAPSATPTTSGASQVTTPTGSGIKRPVSSYAGLLAAISAARPGDVISLAPGTYVGTVPIKGISGTPSAPITIEPAGTGAVTLRANLPMPSCGASGPDENRTITFASGSSWWTLRGLNIQGGVMVAGKGASAAQRWLTSKVNAKDYSARRAIPGRGVNDPVAARSALASLSRIVGEHIVPSDGITFDGDVISVKGIHSRASRYGVIRSSAIRDIACGTGPAVWLGNYSDGWTISGNTVTKVAASTASHYMQEGIRIGGASNYNLVSGNLITDLPGDGRAFTTDVDSSYNTFRGNAASGVAIGFNEQMSGWGNRWEGNRASDYRTAGFSIRMMDGTLSAPSRHSSSYDVVMRCNAAIGAKDFQAGGMANGVLGPNSFTEIDLSNNLRKYFVAANNLFNGAKVVPAPVVSPTLAGC